MIFVAVNGACQAEATPEVATSHTCTEQGCTIERQYSFANMTEAKESS